MRIGLALSGGGARGISHIGSLKAFEEFGIKPVALAGTSAGAIVGAMYAYGYSPQEMLKIISGAGFFQLFRPAWRWTGLLNLDGVRNYLNKLIPDNTFESLNIPLTVAATDIAAGKAAYFSSGELLSPLIASCSIPGIFHPVEINGKIYVDGGIIDNLPVKHLNRKTDFIIGLHCNPVEPGFKANNIKEVIERSMLMVLYTGTKASMKKFDMIIEPKALGKYTVFDLSKAKEIFDIGYKETMSKLKSLEPEFK
jgi:NTE family protein